LKINFHPNLDDKQIWQPRPRRNCAPAKTVAHPHRERRGFVPRQREKQKGRGPRHFTWFGVIFSESSARATPGCTPAMATHFANPFRPANTGKTYPNMIQMWTLKAFEGMKPFDFPLRAVLTHIKYLE